MTMQQNRQAQVMVEHHPDCRACPAYANQLNQQIIANGLLRFEVMDLRQQVRKLGGTPTITKLTAAAKRRLEEQHGIP